jgi:hypothetical protein
MEGKIRALIKNGCDDLTLGAIARKMVEDLDNKSVNLEVLVDYFNDTCVTLPRVGKLTAKRKSALKARVREYSFEEVNSVFDITAESNFLSGRDTKWKASFDWILNPSNFIKIIEGNYGNSKKDESGVVNGQPSNFQGTSRKRFDSFQGTEVAINDGRRGDVFSIDEFQER